MDDSGADEAAAAEETTPQSEEIVHDDGVFTVRIGPSSQANNAGKVTLTS